jgi:DNA-binding NarL/FixJ family response regulator
LSDRVLIVDDQLIIRKEVRGILNAHSFSVCGEAKNGQDAIERVRELKPDIVLLDIKMPAMDGVKAAHEIRKLAPETKIVFLTLLDSSTISESVRMWCHGFICKSSAGKELIPTLTRLVCKANPDAKNGKEAIETDVSHKLNLVTLPGISIPTAK